MMWTAALNRPVRAMCLGIAALTLAQCTALGGLTSATGPLESYELAPLAASQPPASMSGPSLFVEMPVATGALATDRIAIKPDPLRVQYLPGVRWVDSADAHVRLLLIRSLAETGRFSLVTAATSGPLPDHTLLSDLVAFEAVVTPEGPSAAEARVAITLTVLRGETQALSSRRFEAAAPAGSTTAEPLVAAFDRAMDAVLRAAVPWVVARTR